MGNFCGNCGAQLKEDADICLSCGRLTNPTAPSKEGKSAWSELITLKNPVILDSLHLNMVMRHLSLL